MLYVESARSLPITVPAAEAAPDAFVVKNGYAGGCAFGPTCESRAAQVPKYNFQWYCVFGTSPLNEPSALNWVVNVVSLMLPPAVGLVVVPASVACQVSIAGPGFEFVARKS